MTNVGPGTIAHDHHVEQFLAAVGLRIVKNTCLV